MREELLAQLAPILEKTKEGITVGIDLAMKEAPLVVKEVLAWETAIAWGTIGIGLIVLFIGSIVTLFFWALKKETGGDCFAMVMSALSTLAFSLIGIITGLAKVIKIWIAPRLYLLSYIAELLKKD